VEADLARQCHSRAQRATVWLLLAARRRLQRRDIQRAEVVVVPSRRFGEALGRDYHLAPDRLVVVPNPIDLERFRPSDARTAHGKVRVTFVGRAAVRKGIDLLVDLSHRLDDLADEVELEVIATWSLWNDYRPLLEHANPRVAVVRPPVGNADLADVLADSDLLIQPSKYEPFAITVGEALASGTPVVVTEEVGAGEGLDPGCASVVPATAADLEAAVRTWVRRVQSGDVAPARRQARLEAERRFDPRTVSAAIAAVVESVAAHPAPLIR
jgi:glycosyltransferase involved in cell wall biosynthesis